MLHELESISKYEIRFYQINFISHSKHSKVKKRGAFERKLSHGNTASGITAFKVRLAI